MPETNKQEVDRVLRRWRAAQSRKDLWLQHWEDLARLMATRRVGFITERNEGERNNEEIFDGTAMRAARGLANAMAQMLRPEGEQWFFIRAAEDALNEDAEVKAWISAAEDKLMTALFNPKARFRQAAGEADLDLVVFGTAVIFIGRSRNLRHLSFKTLHLKDVAIVYDDEGNPEGLFVVYRYTLRQAELKFGRENLPQEAQEKLRTGKEAVLEEKSRYLHAILPRDGGDPNATLAKNLPFSDRWIDIDQKEVVQEAGFHEFPSAVPRWDTSSGEDYGRSPGMIALPDAATSQAMGETILVAGQRAAAPSLLMPNDSFVDAPNTSPDGIAYYDAQLATEMGRIPIDTLRTGTNLPITRDMQTDVREQIERAFFRNVFNLPIDGPQMTATEIIQRREEFIREIGPVFGRLESDYLAPLVERSFMIMLRSGSFGPPPDALAGQNVRFEYESPVKKIREQADAAAAQLWAMETIAYAEAMPSALDNINFDETARFRHQALNLPQSLVVSRDQVAEVRQARAEAQQAQAQAAAVAQAVQVAETGSRAVKTVTEATQGEAA